MRLSRRGVDVLYSVEKDLWKRTSVPELLVTLRVTIRIFRISGGRLEEFRGFGLAVAPESASRFGLFCDFGNGAGSRMSLNRFGGFHRCNGRWNWRN
jgi:hypothetical protein